MSESKLVSPLLDGFTLGAPISSHSGVCCCPAMKENSDNKYIVKVIAVPASQTQLDALLVTGAYRDPAAALDYFRGQADGIAVEAALLQKLAMMEGFVPYEGWQVTPMKKNRLGYHVYLVSFYRRSLEKFIRRHPVTHLEAVNMALDICSALAMCRRAGYLYIDLKPTNIYVDEDKSFKIGDLGFVAMDSLKYASLPEKYLSGYSAPETKDAMNPLNDTVDTYALGMILYRIFNGNSLPAEQDPTQPLPAPAYADEEMSAIILKACAPLPEDRWKDPTEMGQALVAYMQSNTVNDTPISPDVPAESPVEEKPVSQETVRFVPGAMTDNMSTISELNDIDKTILASTPFLETPEEPAQTVEEKSEPEPNADVLLEQMAISAEEVPEPVKESVPTEEPVAEPETIPEPVLVGAPEESFDLENELLEVNDLLKEQETETVRKKAAKLVTPEIRPVEKKHRGKKLLALLLTLLILAAAGFCGYCFYRFIYLKTIDSIQISGSQDKMIVSLETEVDDSLLTVSCVDTFGNSLQSGVVNGQASFTDLTPDSLYKVSVEISGPHKLVGQIADVFTTEAQTEVVSIAAITGQEDGSVVLTLTVHGHEPEQWTVTCTSDGEPTVTETFSGHSVTVSGLTVGKPYTIALSTDEEMDLMGQSSMQYTASSVISANNLAVISRIEGELTVGWEAPAGFEVDNWSVRCYGEDYDQTKSVSNTLAIFSGTENSKAYTVEVTAAGMTQPTRTTVSANPVTITSMNIDDSTPQELRITWKYDGVAPKEGWLLLYSMDDSEIAPNVLKCSDASALISPRVPGASYQFTIQTVDSTSVFNSVHRYQCPAGDPFSGHAVSSDKIAVKLLPTPSGDSWSADSLSKDVYTSTFKAGKKISMVLEAGVSFYLEHEDINVLFVIRDSSGKVIPNLVEQIKCDWHDMWVDGDYHFCELNVPNSPTEPGNYTVDLYFNGAPVASVPITMK